MAVMKIKNADGSWSVIEPLGAVKVTEQNLTEAEKAQARANIGVGISSGLSAKIVTDLPLTGEAQENVIYMILTSQAIANTGYNDGMVMGSVGSSLSGFGTSDDCDCLFYPIKPGKTYEMTTQIVYNDAVGYILSNGDSTEYGTGEVLEVLTTVGSFTAPEGANGVWLHVNKGEKPLLYGPGEGDIYKEYMLINGEFQQIGDTSIDLTNYVTKAYLEEAFLGGTW